MSLPLETPEFLLSSAVELRQYATLPITAKRRNFDVRFSSQIRCVRSKLPCGDARQMLAIEVDLICQQAMQCPLPPPCDPGGALGLSGSGCSSLN